MRKENPGALLQEGVREAPREVALEQRPEGLVQGCAWPICGKQGSVWPEQRDGQRGVREDLSLGFLRAVVRGAGLFWAGRGGRLLGTDGHRDPSEAARGVMGA